MSDLLAKRMRPTIDALVRAVAEHDPAAVADALNPLDRRGLEGLAITLAALLQPTDTNAEKIEAAISLSARAFGTTVAAITSGSKFREDIDARAVACYASRLCGASFSLIGRHVNRDHSTVMHACSRVGENATLRRVGQRVAGQLGWSREEGAA